jgi:hypothetical protein
MTAAALKWRWRRGTGPASGMSDDLEVHVNRTIAARIVAVLGLGMSALLLNSATAANGYGYS